jgi:DNA polymerase beta
MATDYKPIIIGELDTMRKADIARKKPFEARAYAKVITGLRELETPVTSFDDVKDLPGVGAKIKEKIKEIIETGSLKSAARAREEVSIDTMDALQKIHGVGPVKAKDLIDKQGIKSIEQLRAELAKNPDLLNDIQKIGLKYYEDAVLRIPRKEMEEHEKMLLSSLDPKFKGTIVGSYRRGAVDSGDIDMLLTLPEDMTTKAQGEEFLKFIQLLKDVGYIVDSLATGPKKFMGYVRLEDDYKARRLDLLMTPAPEYAYAILYFTGSQAFNVAFRTYAQSKGYTINEHTMKPVVDGVAAVPPMKTEEDIFAFLGLQYILPTARLGSADIKPLTPSEPKKGGKRKSRSRSRSRKN